MTRGTLRVGVTLGINGPTGDWATFVANKIIKPDNNVENNPNLKIPKLIIPAEGVARYIYQETPKQYYLVDNFSQSKTNDLIVIGLVFLISGFILFKFFR
jgi:hypothetical protein